MHILNLSVMSLTFRFFPFVERGEFLVVVDNEDRENEGDLIIAGEDITPEKAAFMIRYTRYFPLPTKTVFSNPYLPTQWSCMCACIR